MDNSMHSVKIQKVGFWCLMALIGLSKLIKLNFIVGSAASFFSMVNIFGPLSVALGGSLGGLFLIFNNLLSIKIGLGATCLLAKTGIPNFLAGIYLRTNSNFIKILLPATCMMLFWYKTWGTVGSLYAILWLIPIAISLLDLKNIYLKSLGATFVAHAAGSVFFAYFANLTAWQWFALIPLALGERIILAILMGFSYNVLKYVLLKINRQPESAIL